MVSIGNGSVCDGPHAAHRSFPVRNGRRADSGLLLQDLDSSLALNFGIYLRCTRTKTRFRAAKALFRDDIHNPQGARSCRLAPRARVGCQRAR